MNVRVFPSFRWIARKPRDSARRDMAAELRRAWFALIAISVVVTAPRADPATDAAPLTWAVTVADQHQQTIHFKLLGPDWARIPEGYAGVAPMKVVAELNIPQEYLMRNGPLPITENNSSIPIVVPYPSIKAVEEGSSLPRERIYAAISASSEDGSRRGVRRLTSAEGMRREPQLDINGLCAYIDTDHPGKAGIEFYSSCDETNRVFFISCFPPITNRRSCSEASFLGGQFGAQLTYDYSILKSHQAMLNAVRALVWSFVQPSPTIDRSNGG